MKAAPYLAIAVSTSMPGWPQHAGPNVPLRKPRWSRKCALTPTAVTAAITDCTGVQYLHVHGERDNSERDNGESGDNPPRCYSLCA